jgi:N-acetylmuramoyl-L-alanine amidase
MARLVYGLWLVATLAWAKPVIVIDPGHGGNQEGASAPSGHLEKHVALQLAKKLKAALEAQLSAEVVLTRDKDALVHLSERVEAANRHRPDAFISIHLNSMPTQKQRESTQGIETYFLSPAASGDEARKVAARENAESAAQAKGPSGDTLAFILADLQRSETLQDSSRLAYAVHEALVAGTGAADRGVQQAPFYVLMGLSAPAVLVEAGFISHPDEAKKLLQSEYQDQIAAAVAKGLAKFLAELESRDGKK